MNAQRKYRTQSGEWWDLIALRVYGMKKGREHLMETLLAANPAHRFTWRFNAGVELIIPPMPEREITKPLVPWTTVTNG
jgi:phage tail protein X